MERVNPKAVHPVGGFISIYNNVAPQICDECKRKTKAK